MVKTLAARICRAALDLALPPRCRSCDAELDATGDAALLCPSCAEQLALIEWPVCPRCAAAVPSTTAGPLPCRHCEHDKLRFDGANALASYEGLAATLVQRMKVDRTGRLPRLFVDLAWQRIGDDLQALAVDAVAAVPPHGWLRGGQSADAPRLVGELLATRLRTSFANGLLTLRRQAARQVGLSRAGRFANMHGQMSVSPQHRLRGARILIIDDILTTGATVSEAARALKQAGAVAVHVFVVARTPTEELPHVIL